MLFLIILNDRPRLHSDSDLLDILCMCGIDQSLTPGTGTSQRPSDGKSQTNDVKDGRSNKISIDSDLSFDFRRDQSAETAERSNDDDIASFSNSDGSSLGTGSAKSTSRDEHRHQSSNSNSDNTSASSHWKLGALRQYAMSKHEILDYNIIDAGSNLSQGQKQLICLARALLGRSKVILIDEATASVDSGTETLVYKTLAKVAKESQATVLCVCHKLEGVRELCSQVGFRFSVSKP